MNAVEMISVVDAKLRDVGTQSLIDGDKVRDLLMDIRLMLMLELPVEGEILADVPE